MLRRPQRVVRLDVLVFLARLETVREGYAFHGISLEPRVVVSDVICQADTSNIPHWRSFVNEFLAELVLSQTIWQTIWQTICSMTSRSLRAVKEMEVRAVTTLRPSTNAEKWTATLHPYAAVVPQTRGSLTACRVVPIDPVARTGLALRSYLTFRLTELNSDASR